MKKSQGITWVFSLFTLVSLTFFQMGCPSNNSPSNPGNPTATPTPALVIGGFIIQRDFYISANNFASSVWLQLAGQPVTSAGVTLTSTGAGVTLAIPYSGPATSGTVYSLYYSTAAFTYSAGQTYVLSAAVSGQTAAMTMTAPGGNITAYQDSNGAVTQFTDSVAGSNNFVFVGCTAPSTTTYGAFGGPGASFNIPDSGVGTAYSAPGSLYRTSLQVENSYGSGPFNFYISDESVYAVTVLGITVWDSPVISYSFDFNNGASYLYQVGVNVSGAAPTGAGVTLSDLTASQSITLPYSNTYSSGGVSFAKYTYSYSGTSPALPYTPGDSYFLATGTLAGTARVTVTGVPGAIASYQDGATNAITLVSWSYPGTASNSVSINETSPSVVPYGITNATSPVTFLPEATYYSAGHNSVYQEVIQLQNAATVITYGNLFNGTPLLIGETYTRTITIN